MWTPDIVKARFLEAADTEKLLPRPRVGNGAGFWPKHMYTQDDLDGWDQVARVDNADSWARNRKLTREAISRHDECLDWTIKLLDNERHRHIVWRWAFCQVNGWSFSEACKRRGWVRMTAYRRLDASFERIAEHLRLTGSWVRFPAQDWMLQVSGPSAISVIAQGDEVNAPSAIKFTPGYRTEPSTNLLKTEENVEDFAKHLDAVNAERRKMLERKRRAKIGAMAS